MWKRFFCEKATLKHSPPTLPYSSHQEVGSLSPPDSGLSDCVAQRIWQKWGSAISRLGPQVPESSLFCLLEWPRLQAVRTGRPQAGGPAEGPTDGQPRQPGTWVRKPSAACSPATTQLLRKKQPERASLTEPSQPPKPSEIIREWLLLLSATTFLDNLLCSNRYTVIHSVWQNLEATRIKMSSLKIINKITWQKKKKNWGKDHICNSL